MKSAIEVMRFALLMRTILRSTTHHSADHQRRPEVDRQEADAARRRAADAAVERPRRAVDRERQRVDVRVRDDAASGVGALVAVVGDREQQPEVRERREDDDSCGQQARPSGQSGGRSTTSAISAMSSAQAKKTYSVEQRNAQGATRCPANSANSG